MSDGPFTMTGCWRACGLMESPERMTDMIKVIEESIDSRPSLVFDACKALIEYTCKNILTYTNNGYENSWDLPKFIKETAKKIRLTPEDYDGDSVAAPIFTGIARGISTVVQNLGELRSKEGLLAHGAVGYSRQLEATHARFSAVATDALIEMLVYSSRNYWSNVEIEPDYEESPEFNQLLDDGISFRDDDDGYMGLISSDGTEIIKRRKSDVLYSIDREQYIELLKDFQPEQEDS